MDIGDFFNDVGEALKTQEFRIPKPEFSKDIYFTIKDPKNVGSSVFFQGDEFPKGSSLFKSPLLGVNIKKPLNSAASSFGFREEFTHRGAAGIGADKMYIFSFLIVSQTTTLMDNLLSLLGTTAKKAASGTTGGGST